MGLHAAQVRRACWGRAAGCAVPARHDVQVTAFRLAIQTAGGVAPGPAQQALAMAVRARARQPLAQAVRPEASERLPAGQIRRVAVRARKSRAGRFTACTTLRTPELACRLLLMVDLRA